MDDMEWTQSPKPEELRVGLISWAGSYLTYETYKNIVTATAKGLGRRQTWEILVSNEHDTQAVVRLRSLQGLYLLCEADGSLCYGRPRTSHHGCFLLRFHRNGKWTLQCIISGRYLESDGEDVFCNSRVLSAYHMWTPRPALHVHVILYSPINHCYARADPTTGRVWVDAPVPCLEECGFLLHFQDGCYHLETSTHFFLSHLDRLVPQPSSQTAFHMQVRPGGLVALSDGEGGMLYPQGTRLLLGLGSNPHRGEEWFILQRCPTWVSLRSKTRKFLSIIYDVGVYAVSERITPMSLFQFEYDNESLTLQLRTANGCYLAQRHHRTVVANGHPMESDTFFRMHWNCGRIILQSPNGRFLGIIDNGLLMANATIPGQWDATYGNPNPPGETTTLNTTGTPESRSMRISVTQLSLPSLAKHLVRATIHHKRPPPRPWCASDSVRNRNLDVGGDPGHSKFYPEEAAPNVSTCLLKCSPIPTVMPAPPTLGKLHHTIKSAWFLNLLTKEAQTTA
ncbi:fascin-3 isoform X2 [Crocuta crocuta]